uniref:Uncharacterized protein n=1 Tax=Anguilla anguilla TaxID=7936 RepID=A0A0E9R7S1_ANGAN
MEPHGRQGIVICHKLPVLAFDPLAEVLTDLHGEGVIVQLVNLLQVLRVHLLQTVPLSHSPLKLRTTEKLESWC